jgi:cytoskeletal protein RodZ
VRLFFFSLSLFSTHSTSMTLLSVVILAVSLSAVQAAPAPAWFLAPRPVSLPSPISSSIPPTVWYIAEPVTTAATASSISSASSTTTAAATTSSAPSSTSTAVVSSKKGAGYNDDYLTRNLAISWKYNWKSVNDDSGGSDAIYLPMLVRLFFFF